MSKKEALPSNMKNLDSLIVSVENAKLGQVIPPAPEPEVKLEVSESVESKLPVEEPESPDSEAEGDLPEESEALESQTESEALEPEAESKEVTSDDEVDDYGNRRDKKKLYTEEEVNKMMRERFKRGNHAESSEKQLTEAAKEFSPDPNSEESWETQLESFIDRTIEKRESKQNEKEWKRQEAQSMAEFEVKFSEGMTKYSDFNDVVAGKPITNAMMLATRTMDNPAAFLYAACKQQPKEVARIAAITDPIAQATEIGRLEMSMKKSRRLPASPKPASKISGDTTAEPPKISMDDKIAQHAKTKFMRGK